MRLLDPRAQTRGRGLVGKNLKGGRASLKLKISGKKKGGVSSKLLSRHDRGRGEWRWKKIPPGQLTNRRYKKKGARMVTIMWSELPGGRNQIGN